MAGQPLRKGIPIESPESRRRNRSASSHDYLSPVNTLDKRPTNEFNFPLRMNNMPSSYKNRSTDMNTFSGGSLLTDSKEEKSEHFSFDSQSRTSPTTSTTNASIAPVVTSGFKTIKISHIQYRLVVLPPSKTIHSYEEMKIRFFPNDKFVALSAEVDGDAGNVAVPFSKVARIQFIRTEGQCSSDWYIDFVLTNGHTLNFSKFKCVDDPDIRDHSMTLRVKLAKNCGLSIESIENILISIVRDRRAFHFTSIRDRYGEFEASNLSSTPPKPPSVKILGNRSSSNAELSPFQYRFVPSLEKLSSSESVIKPATSSSLFASPDVFDFPLRRTSKRLRGVEKRTFDEGSFTHVDPDFESERVKLFSYPEGEVDSIQVTSHELERLEPGIWLNDTLIDFELKYLFHQLDPNLRERVHVFSSFFYRRLSSAKLTLTPPADANTNEKSGFDLVKSWTRKVNLFEKDFIIIPINENLHWFLAIICHPSRILCAEESNSNESVLEDDLSDDNVVDLSDSSHEKAKILIFDSLGLTTRGKSTAVINRLRTYLQLEARDKINSPTLKSQCTGHVVKVPQQENYTDCGCFVLQFVEEFFKDIPRGIVEDLPGSSYNLLEWFPSAIGQSRRHAMKKRIKALAEDFTARVQHKPETVESNSSDIEEIVMYVKGDE